MPLQATSGAASYDGFGGGVAVVPTYIEDVFSSYLWTGDGSSAQNINNGIDLSGKGGMVWVKSRSNATTNVIVDTSRFVSSSNIQCIFSDSNAAASASANEFGSFNSNGFSIPYNTTAGWTNFGTRTFCSWTFREQPKFFDVVTYTGTGTAHAINHNLGSVPGFIIVKSTSVAGSWYCYHRGTNGGVNPQNYGMNLGATAAQLAYINFWNNTAPTATQFTVGDAGGETNETGVSYIAYLFAHDAGGFGLTGTDNVISCGSFTATGSAQTVTLGYEPQWVLVKCSNNADNWYILDNMRGLPVSEQAQRLYANTSGAEGVSATLAPTATGFSFSNTSNFANSGYTYIYIAIRRGPMKVPTLGTSVFDPEAYTGTSATRTITSGFPVDLSISKIRSQGYPGGWFDRLRGALQVIRSSNTDPEVESLDSLTGFDSNTGVILGGGGGGRINTSPDTYAMWNFGRAPGFFDEVCYKGNGTNGRTITHNLSVSPELIIVKNRTTAGTDWPIRCSVALTTYKEAFLNLTDGTNFWSYIQDQSSTTFTVGNDQLVNYSAGDNYVAYLFATCAGVSKVFSYTGNGSSQTINCGFTGGARFVLIKRTDSTGDWYVWDSARGIVAGNDPHLSLNTTAAEVTTDDSVDTDNTGFIVNQVAATNVNVSSATYIGLAIA